MAEALRNGQHFFAIGPWFENDEKLVAAESANDVAGAEVGHEALGDLGQQLITG